MTFPTIHQIEKIDIIQPDKWTLKNGVQAFGYNGAKNNIIQIDLVYDAGRWVEELPQTATSFASLLKSGTKNKSAEEIGNDIDQWGSTIKVAAGYNTITISIYSIHKYLEPTLIILNEILSEYTFPKDELKIYKHKRLAQLKVNSRKTDYLADHYFKASIFGEQHPYGYTTKIKDLEQLNPALLFDYGQKNINQAPFTLFISGKYNDEVIALLDKYIGEISVAIEKKSPVYVPNGVKEKKQHHKIKGTVQASIVLGKIAVSPKSKDFYSLSVLNTVLGGYFGSRLMKNIREDKGYTYGIHSGIQNYRHASIFNISTDTGIEYVKPCLNEISLEIERLKNELIPQNELERVKSYMMGRILKLTDGPFNKMNAFKSYFITNRDLNNIQELVTCIKAANAASLLEMAQKHYQMKDLYEVVVS